MKIQLNNREENDLNDSDTIIKMNELEANNEALKTKNKELMSKLEEKNKEFELYKNKNKEENIKMKEFEELNMKILLEITKISKK